MEKPFPMKLDLLALAALLLLAGCATTATPPAAAPTPPATAAAGTPTPAASAPVAAPTAPALRASTHPSPAPAGDMKPLEAVTTPSREVVSLQPPADLWERIRRGFAMPDLQTDLVQERVEWYSTRPDYMLRMTERSRKYLFHIVEELERRNMPTELALLPFIESAFNPQAVSSAKAAGMWQFMPATGKHFDLKQNVFRDDRRDVLESTRAALDYLQKLHRMFGDWHLALAAYNWGEGSVGRALARNKAAGLGLSYPELNMPAETRLYVPKLQAVKNIIAQPDFFRAQLPQIENHPYFQTVDIRRDIDVALAAKLAEVRVEDFKALNPSVNRPVILAAGTPQILLPWDNAATFERNLAAHGDGRLASWTAWTAPATMNVAEAARRTGMAEAELRSLNAIPPRMMIKAGSTLLVPRSDRHDQDVPVQVADTGQMALAPEVVLRRSSVRAGKGDTVASLARRYGLTAAAVADWNRTSPSAAFKAGQSVVLYLPTKARASAPGRTAGKAVVRKAAGKKATGRKRR
jgi:membrane-bound lytic murein transglycosylase D